MIYTSNLQNFPGFFVMSCRNFFKVEIPFLMFTIMKGLIEYYTVHNLGG